MKSKKQQNRGRKGIKVTYISSPMKVKTTASNFRALVQELTGQYSNVAVADADASMEEAHHGFLNDLIRDSSPHDPQDPAWFKPDSTASFFELLNEQLLLDSLGFDEISSINF